MLICDCKRMSPCLVLRHGPSLSDLCLEPNSAWFYRLMISCRLEEGNSNPLQYSGLGNPMDGGARRAAVCGTAESDATQ